ncbi:ABC transporter permease [Carboxylicivirga sediminis]|uniref:ABC transporter permease n=1 Tax=Carboxylicivirga sediminis TaxID=2006564 RepID=A0A941F530_9BACT|nr:ABC transporter permease [Carboxylicivirga sediminis]MBR8536602.1 ABC transporter permease [Carboxylicivirga sediminis]
MSKISLIIQREYITRVKKKSFIVMTIIGPILFAAMMVLPGWFASMEDTESKNIAVVDQTGKYNQRIKDTEYLKFSWLNQQDAETIAQDYQDKGYTAYLVIEDDLLQKPDAAKIYSESQITIDVKEHIARNLEKHLENEKLNSYQIDGLDAIVKDIYSVDIKLKTIKLSEDGSEKESSTELVMIAAIIFAMMIYMFVLIYGMQVMRGIMEEKVSRIVEVIVSSVKPFQLMMGKIIGIALVALTQFFLWVVLTVSIVGTLLAIFSNDATTIDTSKQIEMIGNANSQQIDNAQVNEFAEGFTNIVDKLLSLDLIGSLVLFVFYFLGGYLLYASLFAAIGAALDNEADSQQFVMPVMMPLILSIYVAMAAFRNPTGDIAVWFSMIPFTSPVVMMARIPFQPPIWQIIVSMLLLIGTFILTTWFAGRIYRTGILMYGKKVSYKELWKWFKYSGR